MLFLPKSSVHFLLALVNAFFLLLYLIEVLSLGRGFAINTEPGAIDRSFKSVRVRDRTGSAPHRIVSASGDGIFHDVITHQLATKI